MVEVRYSGRLGNNLFQYCFGRIIAEALGYKLKADPIPGFPNTAQAVDGHDYSSGYPVQIISHDYPRSYVGDYKKVLSWRNKNLNFKKLLKDTTSQKIILCGNYERYEYYKEYKKNIKEQWLKTDIGIQSHISPDDIVVCVRRSDFLDHWGWTLPFSYYEEILKKTKYENVYICTENPNDLFLEKFKRYKARIHHGDAITDFHFIMSFNKIIQSNSSFSWWASFLSRAAEIYTPIPLIGYWSAWHPEVNLKVDDESRYTYVKCKELDEVSWAKLLKIITRRISKEMKIAVNSWFEHKILIM